MVEDKIFRYGVIVKNISLLLKELLDICQDIQDNINLEIKYDLGLSIEITTNRLNLVKSYLPVYEKLYPDSRWSIDQNINYIIKDIVEFNLQFDNPYLNSNKWSVRIQEILAELRCESLGLEELLKI